MRTLLGIDVGTSSIKAMLMEENGTVIEVKRKSYEIQIPEQGWAEQDPEEWWQALCEIISEMSEEFPKEIDCLNGVGLSGQMHGLVAVDIHGKPVRPAIIWMDQRATEQLKEINEKITWKEQARVFHNRAFNGFALTSLLWMKEKEPENFSHIHKIFQPKDYIRYCLTGIYGTEVSDASAALLLNVKQRTWASDALRKLGIPKDILPRLGESVEIAGTIPQRISLLTGLPYGTPVIYGTGDQQAQSIGNGVVKEGLMICNIGTGSQVSAYTQEPVFDAHLRTHTFCHGIPGAYTIFGASLSGGVAVQWLKDKIVHAKSFQELSKKAASVAPGSDGLIFLPYLSGERTPHMNPNAKGIFYGLTMEHTDAHMARALMEGVAFALRDSKRILEEIGIPCEKIIASGGACNSPVWLQIQADILGKEVQVNKTKEQACLGACILAGVGVGIYENVETACEQLVRLEPEIYVPRKEYQQMYEETYQKFCKIYKYTKKL